MKKIVIVPAVLGLAFAGIAATALPASASYPTKGTLSRSEANKIQQAVMVQTCLTPNEARAIANAKGVMETDSEYKISYLFFKGTSGSSVQGFVVIFPLQKCAGDAVGDYAHGRLQLSENEAIWKKWADWYNDNFASLGTESTSAESANAVKTKIIKTVSAR